MEAVDEKVIRRSRTCYAPIWPRVFWKACAPRCSLTSSSVDARRSNSKPLALDQQANLAKAIAMTGNVAVLVAELQTVEQHRHDLIAQRDALGEVAPQVDWRLMERRARKLLDDWRGLLACNTTDARPVLRQLLKGALIMTPILEEQRRGYEFEGHVEVGELLTGYVGRDNGVPGQN